MIFWILLGGAVGFIFSGGNPIVAIGGAAVGLQIRKWIRRNR